MSGIFGAPKVQQPITPPPPAPLPPPPDRNDREIQEAASGQRQRFYGSGSSRTSTMLTGGTGAEAPSRVVRFLGNTGA